MNKKPIIDVSDYVTKGLNIHHDNKIKRLQQENNQLKELKKRVEDRIKELRQTGVTNDISHSHDLQVCDLNARLEELQQLLEDKK